MKIFKSIFFILFSLSLNATLTFGQGAVDHYTISIHVKNIASGEKEEIKLEGQAAKDFDVPAFLSENLPTGQAGLAKAEIRINGYFLEGNVLESFRFNSKDLDAATSCNRFCQKVISEKHKSQLGVQMQQMPDFEGSKVKGIIDNSGAASAGLVAGDVITYVEDEEIRSDCDLKKSIRKHDIGAPVLIDYERDGQVFSTTAILGTQLQKTSTWQVCCDQAVVETHIEVETIRPILSAELDVFPNPTLGKANLQFSSDSKEELFIRITDIAGKEIYNQTINDFNGRYMQGIDLTKESAGMYFIQVKQGNQQFTEKLVVQKL